MLESRKCSWDRAFAFLLFRRMSPLCSSSKRLWNTLAQNSCHLDGVGLGVAPLSLGISLIPYVVAMSTFWPKRDSLLFMFLVSSLFSPAAISTFLLRKGNLGVLFFEDLGTQWEYSSLGQLSTVGFKSLEKLLGTAPLPLKSLLPSISVVNHQALDFVVLAQVLYSVGYCWLKLQDFSFDFFIPFVRVGEEKFDDVLSIHSWLPQFYFMVNFLLQEVLSNSTECPYLSSVFAQSWY